MSSVYKHITSHVKIVMLVFSHNDFPLAIRDIFNNDLEGWNFDSDLSQHPKFQDYPMDHTDLPRMKKGRVGGQVIHFLFFISNSVFARPVGNHGRLLA